MSNGDVVITVSVPDAEAITKAWAERVNARCRTRGRLNLETARAELAKELSANVVINGRKATDE